MVRTGNAAVEPEEDGEGVGPRSQWHDEWRYRDSPDPTRATPPVPSILIGIKKTLSDRVLREWRAARGTGFVALDDARVRGTKATGIAQSREARGTRDKVGGMRCPVALDSIRTKDGRERFWQAGGGFDRNIRDGEELAREIEYIHQNPVERGLAEKPTDWKWSSARWYAGMREGTLSIDSLDFH